jgi:hypothetical protein
MWRFLLALPDLMNKIGMKQDNQEWGNYLLPITWKLLAFERKASKGLNLSSSLSRILA